MVQWGGAVVCGASLDEASSVDVKESRADPDRIAILNDTHIGGRHPAGASIPAHLREAVAWLVSLERQPAVVVINGDLALNDGRAEDYTHFARLIAPLREAGIPVHLTLGNHDNREVFHAVLKEERAAEQPVMSRHVGVVSLPLANLFLLDSLKAPLSSPGLLGMEQIRWLGRMLDLHGDKPALVLAHHNPRLGGDERFYPSGLEDSEPLWDLLVSKPHVKAYVHGHLHQRNYSQHRGIHIIDTPATAFVRRPETSATGWTMVQLAREEAEFTTLTHLKDHPWNRAVQSLVWRGAGVGA